MDLLSEEHATAAGEIASWAELVHRSGVWDRVSPGPERDTWRKQARALVERVASRRKDTFYLLTDDPWQESRFAVRMLEQVRWLTDRLPAAGSLSAGEAALLVTAPFVYETLWSGLATDHRQLNPHDLTPSPDASSDRAAFERFTLSFGQPRRRAIEAVRVGRWDVAEEIGWWLLHRWLSRQPGAYRAETVADLLGCDFDCDSWRPGRFAELLRAMRADPGFLARTDRGGVLLPAGQDGVRERFLGYLLAVARALTIEIPALPEVIGEHLGIADPVTVPQLRDTVDQTTWTVRGTGLVLTAACPHPAVEVALRTQVDLINQLLAEAHRAAGATSEPLAHLPTHVTADGVRPALVEGERAYHSAGARFRLAEDRVRELLMGEQLYGDPALAIRELYQNALDACRYREARTEYLRRTAGEEAAEGAAGDAAGVATEGAVGDWHGQIRFTQGVDEHGRAYLDCADNGIGMGVRELTEVFAQAGVRLADLPEFIEEQAEWSRLDPPVQLFPNSRFGIGVLSYFMLADEITVDTCRLGRDGRPGERLRVSIAGPGSLFRIRTAPLPDADTSASADASPDADALASPDAGTTIRLHLRLGGPDVNCVQVLRELLWVADFHTSASCGSDRRQWLAGELSDAPRPGKSGDEDQSGWGASAVAAPGSRVWWCPGSGAVLADGLWAGEDMPGAVVNLSRELAPRLSVDRTRILAYRGEDVDRLLWEAVDALVAAGSAVLTFDWLDTFSRDRPLVADVIFERALAEGYRRWTLGDEPVDAAVTGCFGQDLKGFSGPDELIEWRLTALVKAGKYPGLVEPTPEWGQVVRARPSDRILLSVDADGSEPWLDAVETVPLVHLVRAARRVGRELGEVAARLETLGYTAAPGHDTLVPDSNDLVITSRDLDGERPWLLVSDPVSVLHLLRAAEKTGRPLAEIVLRLRQLGHQVDVDPARLPVDHLEPDDLIIASRDLDGRNPHLAPRDEVTVLHVLRAARKVGRGAPELAARLAALGHQLAPGCASLTSTGDDVILASRDLDSTGPWLSLDDPVSPIHVLRAAEKTGRSVEEIVDRLSLMGYTTTVDSVTAAGLTLEPDDAVLFSRALDGKVPWLSAANPVPPVHVLRAVKELGRPLTELVARMVACGYPVGFDPESVLADQLEADDLVLASVDLDGTSPWLNPGDTVPLTHLVLGARRTRRQVHDVAARLAVLGYGVQLESGTVSAEEFDSDDLLISSRDLDSTAPWFKPDETVPLAHLVLAAGRTRRPVAEIGARMVALGYCVDVTVGDFVATIVEPDDLTLVSEDLDGRGPWLSPTMSVPTGHLIRAARRVRRPIVEVAQRLGALGYQTPDLEVRLPRHRPGGV